MVRSLYMVNGARTGSDGGRKDFIFSDGINCGGTEEGAGTAKEAQDSL